MKALAALSLTILWAGPMAGFEHPPPPDVVFGRLFFDVQRAGVFPDQKTFVDCVPRADAGEILRRYSAARESAGWMAGGAATRLAALREFVAGNFCMPKPVASMVPPAPDIYHHLIALWSVLRRQPDREVPGSSLLALPHPYIVPGGRFREIYYWDSYFTMLGLKASGRNDLIESMVENFAYLAQRYGMIPNGNRTYYLSRSQPPFFSLMLDLLAETEGSGVYLKYLPALRIEYAYWMDQSSPTRHVVRLADGSLLNRYWDQLDTPRDESFLEDEKLAQTSGRNERELYRDLRSAAESGWDFSTRWLGDRHTLRTIRTTRILPVDLNVLLQHLERTLARGYALAGNRLQAAIFEQAAGRRRSSILRIFWSNRLGFFADFDLDLRATEAEPTLAGMMPLFLKLATRHQGDASAAMIRSRFERAGGVVATPLRSGQQWDAPNGWAPLEWITIEGLKNYGQPELAAEIARRWIALNRAVFLRTGRMVEKYDVDEINLPAGGGEYPGQDGFGWTNGVLLGLLGQYPN